MKETIYNLIINTNSIADFGEAIDSVWSMQNFVWTMPTGKFFLGHLQHLTEGYYQALKVATINFDTFVVQNNIDLSLINPLDRPAILEKYGVVTCKIMSKMANEIRYNANEVQQCWMESSEIIKQSRIVCPEFHSHSSAVIEEFYRDSSGLTR